MSELRGKIELLELCLTFLPVQLSAGSHELAVLLPDRRHRFVVEVENFLEEGGIEYASDSPISAEEG